MIKIYITFKIKKLEMTVILYNIFYLSNKNNKINR